jgi:hypothetical protein
MSSPSDRATTERSGPAFALARPRIKVVAGPRLLELAGPERVRELLKAPNAKPIIRKKTGAIVVIEILPHGDDSRLQSRAGNPQRLSHDSETDENPRGVWAFKELQHAG